MAQVSTNEFRSGMKLEIEGQPYVIVSSQFVKPGKGQPFSRVKIKNLLNGRVVEKTYKSGEKFDLADVVETKLRLLYTDKEGAVFMDDDTFEQMTISNEVVGDTGKWLKDDLVYEVLLYQGNAVSITPPTFLELAIAETEPGAKGDTASGRVLKQATTETGAKVMIPIFIDEGEIIKFDTRTGEYVSRASK